MQQHLLQVFPFLAGCPVFLCSATLTFVLFLNLRTATGTHLGVNRPVWCGPELRQQCKLARRRFGVCRCQGYADAWHTYLHRLVWALSWLSWSTSQGQAQRCICSHSALPRSSYGGP